MAPAQKLHPMKRWGLFFFGLSKTISEYIVTVDLMNVWRRHLVWSKKNGDELKAIIIARYSSSSVFLSLLVGTEVGILYSPSKPADAIRFALEDRNINSVAFWTGIAVGMSIFFSVTALVANFTAWGVFSSLSKENAPAVLRSRIGLYSAQLPSRLVIMSIYIFLAVVVLSWWHIMPATVAFIFSAGGLILFFHIVSTFSAISRLIMMTGAMADSHIFPEVEEEKMNPEELSDALIHKARLAKRMDVDVMLQYRFDYQELVQDVEEGRVQHPIPESEFDVRTSQLLMRRNTTGQMGSQRSKLPENTECRLEDE